MTVTNSAPGRMTADNGTVAQPAGRRTHHLALRLSSAERRWLLAAIDVLVLNSALLFVLALRYPYRFSVTTIVQAPIYFAILTVLWWLWASFFDCYDLPVAADASQSAWSTARAGLLTAASYLVIPYYTPPLTSSRLTTLLFVAALVAGLVAWRAVFAVVFSQSTFQRRILIVGAGRSGTELALELAGRPQFGNPYAGSGILPVGFVDDNPDLAETVVAGLPVLGNRYDLRRLVEQHQVDTVVLAVTHTPNLHPELFQALLDCREQGVRLEPMSSLYERLTGKVPVDHAGRNLYVVLPLTESASLRLYWLVKRVGDLLVGLMGLMVLAVVVPGVAVGNRLLCPGPLFYRQARVGRGGRSFQILKFRSMVPNAEAQNGAVWASAGDPRVTPVGRVLRLARIDELPQFWNVLRGDMSLIGPRPERPEFVAQLVQQIPFYQARHAVRPGITGWAQVRYGYGDSVRDALVKLQYDLYFIRHLGLYLELSILVKTAAVMLGLRGR